MKTLLLALLASASCNSDKSCVNASDCPSGYVCAFLVNECVYNPADLGPPDLLGGDLAAPSPDLANPDLAPVARFTSGETATTLPPPVAPGVGLSGPEGVCFDGTNLYVSDSGNNRVLIYNSLTAVPLGVIGQTNLSGKAAAAPPTAATLHTPRGLWCDGKSLLVADAENSRILYYDTSNAATFKLAGTSADGVVGQPDFVSAGENQGGNVSASTLKGPHGVFFDSAGGRLYIADTENYRVVTYALPNGLSGMALQGIVATGVFGQADLKTRSQPGAGVNNGFAWPVAVTVSNGQVAVVDEDFAKVLLFPVPAQFPVGAALTADAVLGQTTLLGTATGATASAFGGGFDVGPQGIYAAPTEFFVADTVNNRVLYYGQPLPVAGTYGLPALAALGQPNLTMATSGAGAAALNGPQGVTLVTVAGKNSLVVADTGNNRVQIFPGQ